jgi:hypothetical protein
MRGACAERWPRSLEIEGIEAIVFHVDDPLVGLVGPIDARLRRPAGVTSVTYLGI